MSHILSWSASIVKEYRRERHSISVLIVHLVCVTAYRKKVFDGDAICWLQHHCERVCAKMGCKLLSLNGEADHIHLTVEYPPKTSVSVLINTLKGTSSRLLRKVRPDLEGAYSDGALWSPAYMATSAGGDPPDMIECFIETQRDSKAL